MNARQQPDWGLLLVFALIAVICCTVAFDWSLKVILTVIYALIAVAVLIVLWRKRKG